MVKLALDAMGGDFAPKEPVLGALKALEEFDDLEITLFGDENKIKQYLKEDNPRIMIVHTDSFIDMGEHNPVSQIRNNPKSSLVLAMKSCKNHETDALVTAGPTQAVIVGAHIIIKRLDGMSRVALAPILPSVDEKNRIMLDVGANVELRPEHLLELAIYGTALAKIVLHVDNPRIGLLNIGTEEGKGRQVDQDTYQLLKSSDKINFVGNIETKDIMNPDCEVMLTDGFTGNMVLKTLEGTAKGVGNILKQEIKRTFLGKIGALFMKKNLNNFKDRLSGKEVGGAMLCGVSVPVVKSHGSSNYLDISYSIKRAYSLVKSNLVEEVIKSLPQKEDEENV